MRKIIAIVSSLFLMGLATNSSTITNKITISDPTLSNDSRTVKYVKTTLQDVLLLKLDTLYSGRLKSNPKLAGIIKIKMTIDPDGSITDAKILTETTADKEFPRQVLSMVKNLTFDPGVREIDATYIMTFGEEKPAEPPTGDKPSGGNNK